MNVDDCYIAALLPDGSIEVHFVVPPDVPAAMDLLKARVGGIRAWRGWRNGRSREELCAALAKHWRLEIDRLHQGSE